VIIKEKFLKNNQNLTLVPPKIFSADFELVVKRLKPERLQATFFSDDQSITITNIM